jgi:crotonobetainyl-CoA:carnitine CoA-transferase CaiB-like acyl-CoA transferase
LREVFLPPEFADDERLRTAVQREAARDWVVPQVAAALKHWKSADLCAALEAAGLSYGPIREPHDLLDDPHLREGEALIDTRLPSGEQIAAAALPIEFDGRKAASAIRAGGGQFGVLAGWATARSGAATSGAVGAPAER